jgi:hypothetical protein
MSFADLKRKSQSNFEFLQKELEKSSTQSGADERLWKPELDASGNGYAVIRFLPAPPEEDVPFIRIFDHGFQGPGGWYIENSLTTLGKNDPVSEHNSSLWNSGVESNKDIARKQKRRLHFISNIYVIQDPGNPENEGKVFLYKYGKKIFDKLNEAMNPQFADEEAVNPFDLWVGANFKLKIRNVEGYRNYDKSEFEKAGPLKDDDSLLEEIWKKEHSIKAFLDLSNFKTYDELKGRLAKVLNESGGASRMTVADEEDIPWGESTAVAPKQKEKAAAAIPAADDDDDESLEFFKSLAG